MAENQTLVQGLPPRGEPIPVALGAPDGPAVLGLSEDVGEVPPELEEIARQNSSDGAACTNGTATTWREVKPGVDLVAKDDATRLVLRMQPRDPHDLGAAVDLYGEGTVFAIFALPGGTSNVVGFRPLKEIIIDEAAFRLLMTEDKSTPQAIEARALVFNCLLDSCRINGARPE